VKVLISNGEVIQFMDEIREGNERSLSEGLTDSVDLFSSSRVRVELGEHGFPFLALSFQMLNLNRADISQQKRWGDGGIGLAGDNIPR
jgi:hypothetical protein